MSDDVDPSVRDVHDALVAMDGPSAWVSLHTGDPSVAGTEVSAAGYTRRLVPVSFDGPSEAIEIVWAPLGASVHVTHIGLHSIETGGLIASMAIQGLGSQVGALDCVRLMVSVSL